jgi:hypothetical protein
LDIEVWSEEKINQLSSTGSFRFTTNYNTKNLRYLLKHILFRMIY